MYHFSPRVCSKLTLVTTFICLAAASRAQAQATLASTTTTSGASSPIATQSSNWHRITPDKLISAQVQDGVLAIDGMVAKVQLNYEIQRAGYMYFFVPGVGTAVISLAPMPDAMKVKDAFEGSKLAFTVDGHTFELTSKGNLLSRDKAKTDVYVRLDSSTVAASRYPRMGFGNVAEAPYVWPLSAPAAKDREAHFVTPPPLPSSVLPRTEASTASAGSTNRP